MYDLYIKILPAERGDCILIKFFNESKTFNILIDGGLDSTYRDVIKPAIENDILPDQFIDLLVVTHVDEDHIQGILEFIADNEIDKNIVKKYWFNSGQILSRFFNNKDSNERLITLPDYNNLKLSIKDGIKLEEFLVKTSCWHETPLMNFFTYNISNALITILSPDEAGLKKLDKDWQIEATPESNKLASPKTKEITERKKCINDLIKNSSYKRDDSIPNLSSIAFMFELKSKKILFLADAHSEVIENSLKELLKQGKLSLSENGKIKFDCVKLSHHGSKANIRPELIDLIDCQKYIISTDGSYYSHPNKEALSRIVHKNTKNDEQIHLIFNYPIRNIFLPEEEAKYNFKCFFPDNNIYSLNYPFVNDEGCEIKL